MSATRFSLLEELTPEQIARFWAKVDVRDEDECWPWLASHHARGYGRWRAAKDSYHWIAPRLALTLALGRDIPRDMCACHSCDNPPCVNPAHLFVGTVDDNIRDKMRKGRQLKGQQINTSKLTPEQVYEIRARYDAGEIKGVLSREFGVSRPSINAIGRREHWRHLPERGDR